MKMETVRASIDEVIITLLESDEGELSFNFTFLPQDKEQENPDVDSWKNSEEISDQESGSNSDENEYDEKHFSKEDIFNKNQQEDDCSSQEDTTKGKDAPPSQVDLVDDVLSHKNKEMENRLLYEAAQDEDLLPKFDLRDLSENVKHCVNQLILETPPNWDEHPYDPGILKYATKHTELEKPLTLCPRQRVLAHDKQRATLSLFNLEEHGVISNKNSNEATDIIPVSIAPVPSSTVPDETFQCCFMLKGPQDYNVTLQDRTVSLKRCQDDLFTEDNIDPDNSEFQTTSDNNDEHITYRMADSNSNPLGSLNSIPNLISDAEDEDDFMHTKLTWNDSLNLIPLQPDTETVKDDSKLTDTTLTINEIVSINNFIALCHDTSDLSDHDIEASTKSEEQKQYSLHGIHGTIPDRLEADPLLSHEKPEVGALSVQNEGNLKEEEILKPEHQHRLKEEGVLSLGSVNTNKNRRERPLRKPPWLKAHANFHRKTNGQRAD
jgi:hypothetical protein